MNLTVVAIASIGFFVAYTNGANDVSKGIATLAGSGVSSYRNATLWGALWTTCGSHAAIAFSGALVTTFGKGLLAASVSPTLPAAVAALIGAGLWVGLATRLELPVSTTHAIVGSIAGVMSVAYGTAGTNWHTLTGKIALPLVLSPLASLLLTIGLLKLRNRLSPQGADCLYAEIAAQPAVLASASADIPLAVPAIRVVTCQAHQSRVPPTVLMSFDRLHWITSAATSLARGLNDAPKMVALVLAAAALSGFSYQPSFLAYLMIAFGILVGSLQAGRRVTMVLAEKITPMDHREGLTANLVTSLLVGFGASLGLPMSTTQVSTGAIIGIGVQKDGAVDWRRVMEMALAWVVTLPAAALIGILSYGLLRVARIM